MASTLGFGAGQLGALDEAAAARLLHAALDHGVRFFDTARGYEGSEQRLGSHLGGARQHVVLCTKVGYGMAGVPDWTGRCITVGVEAALGRLRTSWLDVVLLHSCPRDVLERGEVIAALEAAQRAGKVRVIGYSGEGDALDWAIDSGRFGAIETSVNLCDQGGITSALARAHMAGLGVVAKRPLANAFWRFDKAPVGDYCEPYWRRWQQMGPAPTPLPMAELALRFTLSTGAHTAIVGTTSQARLAQNVAAAALGPLPDAIYAQLRAAFRPHSAGWPGQI